MITRYLDPWGLVGFKVSGFSISYFTVHFNFTYKAQELGRRASGLDFTSSQVFRPETPRALKPPRPHSQRKLQAPET